MPTSASATETSQDRQPSTLRGLIASHKAVALGVAALIAVMAATFLAAALGAKAGAVTDSTTCTQWGSANVDRQAAYSRLYLREHRPVSPRWGPAPVGVINAINAGCDQAFGEDVSDSVSVVQAISRNF
ncbi:MAG: hypothetical protein ACRDLP_03805 [Solirubrobacteraceae bacterium]